LSRKRRYILLDFIVENRRSLKSITRALKEHMIHVLGEDGIANADMGIETYGNFIIIKTNSKMVEKVRSSVVLFSYVGNDRILPKVLGISGTLKKLRKKFLCKPDKFEEVV